MPDGTVDDIIKDYTRELKASLSEMEICLLGTGEIPARVKSDLIVLYAVLRALYTAKYGLCEKCGHPKQVESTINKCGCGEREENREG